MKKSQLLEKTYKTILVLNHASVITRPNHMNEGFAINPVMGSS
jgi:hypothetical protein